ncbi:hypothetical protein [Methylobacterium gnaphalii]|nr:hypothetical protein [Methylobacterium gnaphalii]GJD71516.1 hypothetical protein MMMDOFMJ_4477 [Methylobacterium gnaphalii]
MTPTKKLARVLTNEVEGGFHLTLEAQDGEIFRIFLTEDQMGDLADEIDEVLSDDDNENLTAKADEPTTEEQPS